jgi:hypothetical protein
LSSLKEFFEKTLPQAIKAVVPPAFDTGDPAPPARNRAVSLEVHDLHMQGHITKEESERIHATLKAQEHDEGHHDLVDAARRANEQAAQLALQGCVA